MKGLGPKFRIVNQQTTFLQSHRFCYSWLLPSTDYVGIL